MDLNYLRNKPITYCTNSEGFFRNSPSPKGDVLRKFVVCPSAHVVLKQPL